MFIPLLFWLCDSWGIYRDREIKKYDIYFDDISYILSQKTILYYRAGSFRSFQPCSMRMEPLKIGRRTVCKETSNPKVNFVHLIYQEMIKFSQVIENMINGG